MAWISQIQFKSPADRIYTMTGVTAFATKRIMLNDDFKRRVKDATNIVDVVQSAVGKLKRAGRNWVALCPFHTEKSPSFNVNPEGQFFKCYGCGKGGDVFTFVMLM